MTMGDFRKLMREKMALLKLDDRFAARYVNDGFSGGEKKRLEMLQMAVLEPEFAILDETDSGLDIDALRVVAEGVNAQLNPDLGVLVITHYQRLLNYIKPDVVHVLARGRILETGGRDLALRLEEEGYGPILRGAGYEEDLAARSARGRRRIRARWRDALRRAIPMAIVHALDPVAIRADFPQFERDFDGRRLAYLDSASTSLKPRVVIDAVEGYLSRYTANVHRGIYTTGEEATAAYEAARTTTARFLNADRHEIVFVRNATEAINLVAYSWGRRHIASGDTIVLTELEHHANLVPWQILAQERDADLEFVPIDDQGRLIQASYEVLLRTRPKLVAFNHVSNGLGTINPVREMVAMAHEAGALVLVDGAQAVPHLPVDVQEHRRRLLRLLRPQDARAARLGRAVGQARAARVDAAVPGRRRDDPRGPPAADRVQRCALEVRGRNARHRLGHRPRSRPRPTSRASAWTRSEPMSGSWWHTPSTCCLDEVPGIRIYGPLDPAERGGVVTFNLPGVHAHDVATLLDREAIAVRAGHHCTQPLHERLGEAATARASFNVYSDRDDIDRLAAGLAHVAAIFGRDARDGTDGSVGAAS